MFLYELSYNLFLELPVAPIIIHELTKNSRVGNENKMFTLNFLINTKCKIV